MKSLGNGGNVKMRGKLTRRMSCSCCVAFDFRPRERRKEAIDAIKQWLTEKDSAKTTS